MWSIAFGLIAFASLLFLFVDDPERATTASADGRVTVTGVARAAAPFVVAAGDAMTGSVLFGSAYAVMPSGATLDEPVVLSFALDGIPVDAGDVVVYRYDADALMWEVVLPIVAHTDELIAIETSELGTFALGIREAVATPEYVALYDDLADAPPTDAVGYVILGGYAREGEPVVRLSGVLAQGGCGGAVMPGVHEERSVVTRSASVLVDDVATPLTLTFLVRWFIHDGVGCPEGRPFHSADDYGILPTSS